MTETRRDETIWHFAVSTNRFKQLHRYQMIHHHKCFRANTYKTRKGPAKMSRFLQSLSTVWVKKVAPPKKTFCNIFTQSKYFPVKFCLFIASYQFWSNYLNIWQNCVNFSGSTYRFVVSGFSKSDCLDFIANDEWFPTHPTSVHWIIRLGRNAGVLSQAATEAKNGSQFKNAVRLFGLCYQRKPLTTLWKTFTSDCRHMC